ncbi:Eco57I restriction-modification methylase domain-containing protein [uncultured Akkermansia sp.]|uniref:Eco57I restriction-modification methylase domain-containing protein n=3 Tax=uncultured Akkermansia sp. TaxID=512294 RepID=UPI00262BAC43|nr:Eco57I restriction-modification methylase domain-containing protein [uncultured Akkermansia sp.]
MNNNIHNPDVLSCLANLSSDEVFTPPEIANAMLDLLPQELFSDPSVTFLDPCCKSGVFLREIAKRLNKGLEAHLPNREERLGHIFRNQLFGIAITELTSLLARRGVYCSKYPNGPYSVVRFDNAEGNIRYKHITHTWRGGKCVFCGASQAAYGEQARQEGLESHAYEFIHANNPNNLFPMNFDVIIGNPPYQLSDGGGDGSSAQPIYQKFVHQAKRLNPSHLAMIIPARWYSGGKGLDNFRAEMLNDQCMKIIHDFPETADCFPGINIRGGVCYFLWGKKHKGDCLIVNHKNSDTTKMVRPLLEKGTETFIRHNAAVLILSKVKALHEETMDNRVSSRLPFGIPSNFTNYTRHADIEHSIILYRSDRSKHSDKKVFVAPINITKNIKWKDSMKVLVSKASPGNDEYPHAIISAPVLAEKNSVCTETYLIVDFVRSKEEGKNLISYMKTRFFRFMMSLIKNTQNISKGVFAFVPVQNWSKPWTDEELYAKYGLTEEEIEFIESMIRPMEG